MGMLWEFLDSSTPLNPLLASFVSKVIGMLLNREANVVSARCWVWFGAKGAWSLGVLG
jgi:hypothetical protein